MPAYIPYLCLLIAIYLAGCRPAESNILEVNAPPIEMSQAAAGVDIRQLPDERSSAQNTRAVQLENNAEKRTALTDYTEKVYIHWNAALRDYRKKHNRWPDSLPALQQHQPDTELPPPPPGFNLQLDMQAGEIYLTRTGR